MTRVLASPGMDFTPTLRDMPFCATCGRRMEGAWRANKVGESGRTLSVPLPSQEPPSGPTELAEHPRSLYVREDAILGPRDAWITSLTSAEALAAHPQSASGQDQNHELQGQIVELDRKIGALVTAIASGVDIPQLTEQLKRRAAEREGQQARVRAQSQVRPIEPAEIQATIDTLGGLPAILANADPADRTEVYRSLGLKLNDDHQRRIVVASATEGCVFNRVRRGTCPLGTHVFTIELS